jgi:hypothetical protein
MVQKCVEKSTLKTWTCFNYFTILSMEKRDKYTFEY